jgi:hypothetical protein
LRDRCFQRTCPVLPWACFCTSKKGLFRPMVLDVASTNTRLDFWTPKGAAISQRERTSGRNPAALTRFSSESGCSLRCACFAEKACLTCQDTSEECPKSTAQYGLCAGPMRGSNERACSHRAAHFLRSVPRSRSRQPVFRRVAARAPRCSDRK